MATDQIPPGSMWLILSINHPVGAVMSQSLDGVWTTAQPRPPQFFNTDDGDQHLHAGTVILVGETVQQVVVKDGKIRRQDYVQILTPIFGYITKTHFDKQHKRLKRIDECGDDNGI